MYIYEFCFTLILLEMQGFLFKKINQNKQNTVRLILKIEIKYLSCPMSELFHDKYLSVAESILFHRKHFALVF